MPEAVRSLFYELRDIFLGHLNAGIDRVRRDRSLLDVRSNLGETLLHWMAVENQLSVVKALSETGSAIDTANHFGSTPLQEAAQLGHTEVCEFLLARGADPTHKNATDETVLDSAAHLKRHTKLVAALLDAIPSVIPIASLLQREQVVALNFRDDAVALLFRERGLPVMTDPSAAYHVADNEPE